MPHLDNIIRYNQYDNIFHEHIGFHSLKSIIDLSIKHNMKVFDVEKIDSQGGSIRCFLSNKNSSERISRKVLQIVKEEHKLGLNSSIKLKKFKVKILLHIKKLKKLLENLKKNKKEFLFTGLQEKARL